MKMCGQLGNGFNKVLIFKGLDYCFGVDGLILFEHKSLDETQGCASSLLYAESRVSEVHWLVGLTLLSPKITILKEINVFIQCLILFW